jgi:Protein of unknown function (DUF3352)
MLRISRPISVLAVLICAFAVVAIAGCGGGGDGGSSSASGSGLANLASPGTLVFVEGKLKPTGELKKSTDALAGRLAGVDSLGELVVSELEDSARKDGSSFDFSKEVEPWLGEEAGVAFERLVDGELSEPLIAIQSTDPKATQAFVDRQAKKGSDPYKDASYGGVGFKVGGAEHRAVGVIGEALVIANGEKEFKAAVDASQGDSLAGEDRFQRAIAAASNGSLADAYIDVGGLLEGSKDKIDPQAQEVLEGAGIDAGDATAVASVIPQSDRVQIDLSSDLGGAKAPSGDASKLLGTLPADSFIAVAFSEFGEQLEEAVDTLDEEGIPPELKPGELKSSLSAAGINLDKIAASLEDGAAFAEGPSRKALDGALVLTGNSGEAADAVASLGTLLRGAKIPGITAVTGKASGFSIHSGALGNKPIVVLGKGNRVSVGYGAAPAFTGIAGASGPTLSGTAGFKAASAALGKTPISAYVDGPAALRLAETIVPHSKSDFWNVVPYLKKIAYIGVGSGTSDELATARLIAGVGK